MDAPIIAPRATAPWTKNKPYIASYVCLADVGGQGTPFATGSIYRDGRGRTRVEFRIDEVDIRIIDDPEAKVVLFIGPDWRQRESYGSQAAGWSYRGVSPSSSEGAEIRTIHGVQCRCVDLLQTSGEPAGTTWLSHEEGIVLVDDNPGEGSRWEITALRFEDPDPGLFAEEPHDS